MREYRFNYGVVGTSVRYSITAKIDARLFGTDEYDAVRSLAYGECVRELASHFKREVEIKLLFIEKKDDDGHFKRRQWHVPKPLEFVGDITRNSAMEIWP